MSKGNLNGFDTTSSQVDIDSLEVSLFVLCKNQAKFETTKKFLDRRNWPTRVFTSVNELISCLSKEKPEYVLISADYPSPKTAQLPKLLVQTFNVEVIAFIEEHTGNSMVRLSAIQTPLKISNRISGPTLFRNIKKFLSKRYGLDKNTSNQSKKTFSSESSKKQNEFINIKSSQTAKEAVHIKSTKSPEESIEELSGRLTHQPNSDISNYKNDQQERYTLGKSEKSTPESDKSHVKKTDALHSVEQKKESDLPINSLQQVQEDQPGVQQEKKEKEQIKNQGEQYTKKTTSQELDKDFQNTKNLNENTVANTQNKNTQNKSTINDRLSLAIETALSMTAFGEDVLIYHSDRVDFLYSFLLNFPKLKSNYIISLHVSDPETDSRKFCEQFFNNFQESLDKIKEKFQLGKINLLSLEYFDFKSWNREKDIRTYSYQQGKGEAVVSALEVNSDFTVKIDADIEKIKTPFPVKNIPVDTEIDFNVYLYLRDNKKYFKYVANGKKISPKQKQRLMNRDQDLHVDHEDVEKLNEYLMKEKINNFFKESKKAS